MYGGGAPSYQVRLYIISLVFSKSGSVFRLRIRIQGENENESMRETMGCQDDSYLEPFDELSYRVHVLFPEAESLRGDGHELVTHLVPGDVAQHEFS